MLRQLRKDAGKERDDAAEWLEISQQTLSKIELGRQTIKAPHVRLLCQLYDVDAGTLDNLLRLAKEANQRGWWVAYRDTVPESFRRFVGHEADAAAIWDYQAEYVPGLLQTPAYVAAITRASRPNASDAEVNRSVSLRRERQERLDEGEPPQLRFYLNEAVIRRTVGGAEVMREQLEHLVAAGTADHIELRIVPFSAGAHAAMSASFIMMRFPDEPEPAFAYVENDRGAVYQEDPGDIDRYNLILSELDRVALSHVSSRSMIESAAESL
ncbi:helix-turn-helix domain-containing protein [Saccharopolyspora cebuensis]|uniref:Helix-turn-helix domain-containing protein n=1 Tax=Saccharopolyspora cebuensis TaxID=418759 RepID=A0ABV4CM94_9PSEU